MTTIAVRAGLMAADSMMGGGIRATYKKITRWKGFIIGGAGNLADVQAMMRWFTDGGDVTKPPTWVNHAGEKPDAELLVLLPDGSFYTVDDHMARQDPTGFWAIGSGAKAALAAMHMGADARDAVQIAMLVDPHTGGAIETASWI